MIYRWMRWKRNYGRMYYVTKWNDGLKHSWHHLWHKNYLKEVQKSYCYNLKLLKFIHSLHNLLKMKEKPSYYVNCSFTKKPYTNCKVIKSFIITTPILSLTNILLFLNDFYGDTRGCMKWYKNIYDINITWSCWFNSIWKNILYLYYVTSFFIA